MTTTKPTMVFAFDGKRVARVEETRPEEELCRFGKKGGVFSPGKKSFGGEDCDYERTTLAGAAPGGRNGRRRINVKREMKRFMASETKRIVGKDDDDDDDDDENATTTKEKKKNTSTNKNTKNAAADSKFSMKQMRREVRDFGIKGLNKWDRKELEDEKLKALGMKPSKGIRIPATVGVGLWKKNEQRKRREAVRRVSTRAQVREEREDEDDEQRKGTEERKR